METLPSVRSERRSKNHEKSIKFYRAGGTWAFSCCPMFRRLVCSMGFGWMSLFVRVNTSFYGHLKTIKLRAKLGNDAFWIPPRIWALAAEQRPNGEFEGISPEELAIMLGYVGDANGMLQALLQAGFMDSDPLRIHDWAEYNGYHAVYAERARVAAKARWAKKGPKKGPKKENRDREGDEKRGEEASIATSMLQASSNQRPPVLSGESPASAGASAVKGNGRCIGQSQQSDDIWIVELADDPAYVGIDVQREYRKMTRWCSVNRKNVSRRRFINWLNRAEKPMAVNGAENHSGPNI